MLWNEILFNLMLVTARLRGEDRNCLDCNLEVSKPFNHSLFTLNSFQSSFD